MSALTYTDLDQQSIDNKTKCQQINEKQNPLQKRIKTK